MKKILPIILLIVFLLSACGSQPDTYIDYPGNTGIPIENGLSDIPIEVYTQTGAENGLAGTVYSVVGTVKEVGRDGITDYFIVTTDKGDVWIGDYSDITVEESLALGYEIDLTQLKKYYPQPSVGQKIRVVAEYQGMSELWKLPAFTYGSTDYMTQALMISAYSSWDEFTEASCTTEPLETKAPTSPPETQAPTEPPEKGTVDNPYRAGMYKVGTDLPAGEYLFFSTGSSRAYVCASTDSNQDDILENENFNGTFFMTVSEGQYLEAKRCNFIKASEGTVKISEDGSFGEGTYRVGIDIPAGEYRLTSDEDRAYWCLYPNSRIPFDIYDNDNFEGSTFVTVRDGQYLYITRCTAEPV